MLGLAEPVDDGEMVPVRLDDRGGGGTQSRPDIGEQGVLAQEFRALVAAGPAGDAGTLHGAQQRRAFRKRLRFVDGELPVHRGRQERAQVVQARNGDDVADAPPDLGHERRRRRDHPADQVPAGRMPRQHQRAVDDFRRLADRRRDFPDDLADARVRAERVGRHGDGVAMGERARGQMRPIALVELQPVAAVHEDDETSCRAFRQEEVRAVSRPRAVGKVQPCPSRRRKRASEGFGRSGPRRRPSLAARDVRAVGIGLVPVRNAVFQHRFHSPLMQPGRRNPPDGGQRQGQSEKTLGLK